MIPDTKGCDWFEHRVKGLIREKDVPKVWARVQQVYSSLRPAWISGEVRCNALRAHAWMQWKHHQSSTPAVDLTCRAMLRNPCLLQEITFVIAVMECERIKDIEAGVCVAENYLGWFIKNGTKVPWAYIEDWYLFPGVLSLVAVEKDK